MAPFETNIDRDLHAARGYLGYNPIRPHSGTEFLKSLETEYGSWKRFGEIAKSSFIYLAPVIAIGSRGSVWGGRVFHRLLSAKPNWIKKLPSLLNKGNFSLTVDELASAVWTGAWRFQSSGENYGEAYLNDFGEGMIARTFLNQVVTRTVGRGINQYLLRFFLMPAFLSVGGWFAESVVEKDKKLSDAISGGIGWELGYRWVGAFSMMHVQSNLPRFAPRLIGLPSFHADDWVHNESTPATPVQATNPAADLAEMGIRPSLPFAALRNTEIKTIADIHDGHFVTPHRGRPVKGLQGVVTAVARGGFWIQDLTPTASSGFHGIHVRTEQPTVRPGDLVSVDGEVSVFQPGPRELSQTQIGRTTYRVVGQGKLPEPVLIGEGGQLPPPTLFKRGDTVVDLEDRRTPFRPDQDAIAFYRSLDDTRVRVRDAKVVGVSSRSSLCAIAIDGGKHLRYKTPEGLPILMPDGPNTDVITIDFKLVPPDQRPKIEMGDQIIGDLVGVLDYSYGQFRLIVTEPVRVENVKKSPIQRQTVTTLIGDEDHLTVADSNFENFFPKDLNPRRIKELARIVIENMKSPDIIALQEGMDNSGPADDGTVRASYELLNEELRRLGGKEYQYVEVSPRDKQDGGKPGGNIRVAYLVRTDRVTLKLHDPGDSDDPARLEMRDGGVHLAQNPSRVDPQNPAYEHSRKPLAIEYQFNGRTIIQVNMHSTSRRGDDPLWGRYQPPAENSTKVRINQHRPVAAFWQGARGMDPDVNFIAGGDLNAYAWEESVRLFVEAGLVDLAEAKLPPGAHYTYYFDGTSHFHSFDHLVVSPGLAANAKIEILHLNTGLRKQFSDHDIKIARFHLPKKKS